MHLNLDSLILNLVIPTILYSGKQHVSAALIPYPLRAFLSRVTLYWS